ncbi:MAG: PLP-dependent aspartate aminotransferase family protein [Phycisphaerales bacterium]|nr:PLP-dependent aspartate aminotransferase family protein [Phycisphaerales bacterium]
MAHEHAQPLHPDTMVIHAGQRPEPVTGAVMPPIFTSSTYAQRSPGEHTGFEYSRSHNPTRYALERMMARLEGSTLTEAQDVTFGGFAFASGLAAMDCVLELLSAGDEVVCMDDVYGGTNRQFQKVKARSQGLKVKFVDLTDPANLSKAMTSKTSLVWLETPTNPTLKLVDLAAISAMAKKISPSVLVVCDNTFCSPMNQQPLALGCDIAMHSATKYLGGHSDVVGGMLVTGNADLAAKLRFHQNAVGAVMGPFDAYLVLRGIKTLAIRMQRHNASGVKVAQWLESKRGQGVERVIYPGLSSHPQHSLAKRQMKGMGGMITFFIEGGLDQARAFLENTRLFTLAESLGGVESLIEHPAIMTHASVPPAMRQELGISDTLIRLSVGIEDSGDLIADLERALAAATHAGSTGTGRVRATV